MLHASNATSRFPYSAKLGLAFLTRKLFKPQVDRWVGIATFGAIIIYIVLYSIFQMPGFTWGYFDPRYLVIVIPIWTIDGMRGIMDIVLAKEYKQATEDIDKVAVVIACKDGEDVIGTTLADLTQKLNPKQIIVASNGSTDATCDIARKYGVICLDIKQPVGKVRAINSALQHVKTPYVLLLDDDTLLDGATIPTSLLDAGYTGVAFRVHIRKNKKKMPWITHLQAHEYRKSSDIGKRRHNKHAAVQNISGAVGLYTRDELLRQTRIHTAEFSGEDLQRTLLLHLAKQNKGVVLSDSIVYTEAPSTFKVLYSQRVYGWFPGQYANFKNYLHVLFGRNVPFGLREDAFYNIFCVMFMDMIRVLALPIIIMFPWYFVVMYGVYIVLESCAYFKNGHKEPFWVVLVYPFYGLFGLFTRVAALAVFLYRRMAVTISEQHYFDDYRRAGFITKLLSFTIVMMFFGCALGLNVQHNYSHFFTNIDWTRAVHTN